MNYLIDMGGLTIAQKQMRLGYFNASTVEALMKPKGFGDTGMTYIYKKVAERETGEFQGEIFTTPEMQWGIDHEEEAIKFISEKEGIELIKNEEIFYNEQFNLSGTPDCVHGFEIKCPSSYRHIMYRQMKNTEDLKKVAPIYYWQCIAYMFLLNRDAWIFASYDPRIKNKELYMLYVTPEPGEFEFFIKRLVEAKKIYEAL